MNHRSGELRRKIILQQRSTTQDSAGGQAVTWTDLARVSAAIQPMTGRELLASQVVHTEVTTEIVCRYRADLFGDPKVTAALRAVYLGRVYDIHAVIDEDMRHVYVRLLASEGLTNG